MTIPTLKIYEIRIVYAYKIFFFEKKNNKKKYKLLWVPFTPQLPPPNFHFFIYAQDIMILFPTDGSNNIRIACVQLPKNFTTFQYKCLSCDKYTGWTSYGFLIAIVLNMIDISFKLYGLNSSHLPFAKHTLNIVSFSFNVFPML